eukprot:3509153-Amphidinium_carterae.1
MAMSPVTSGTYRKQCCKITAVRIKPNARACRRTRAKKQKIKSNRWATSQVGIKSWCRKLSTSR